MTFFLTKCSVACYRVFIGSNSDYVLHNASCPVAVVRHVEEDLKIHDPLSSSGGTRKIVIAVDESREVLQLIILLQAICTPAIATNCCNLSQVNEL